MKCAGTSKRGRPCRLAAGPDGYCELHIYGRRRAWTERRERNAALFAEVVLRGKPVLAVAREFDLSRRRARDLVARHAIDHGLDGTVVQAREAARRDPTLAAAIAREASQ